MQWFCFAHVSYYIIVFSSLNICKYFFVKLGKFSANSYIPFGHLIMGTPIYVQGCLKLSQLTDVFALVGIGNFFLSVHFSQFMLLFLEFTNL